MSVVKNLEVTVSEAKPNTFHFTCTVPGRIVQENRVSGIFVSDSEWLDWVVIIERGGKVIERHMKNTPLMRRTVILYKSDLDDSGLGIGWDGLLDAVGIDTHSVINGKIVRNEIEEIEIVVHSATITAIA